MRGMVDGLPSPAPVVTRLPGVYQEEDFVRRFTAAFDDLLAPVFVTLDGLPAYVHPALAPADFVDWLLSWVAIEPDDHWTVERRREIVAQAASLHRLWGTAHGVREAVRLVVGGEVEVTDSGGSAWSRYPGGQLQGGPVASVHVRVRTSDPGAVSLRRLDALVAALKPAHVLHSIEVVGAPDASPT
jgi:phage tail-like protein